MGIEERALRTITGVGTKPTGNRLAPLTHRYSIYPISAKVVDAISDLILNVPFVQLEMQSMWSAAIRRRSAALRLIRAAGAEVSADYGKSMLRQLAEISVRKLQGYNVADYYLLGLYKEAGRNKRFMTKSEYDDVRRRLNKQVCGIIEFNKWVFGKYCEATGIPTPHCYGVFHKEIGFAEDLRPLRSQDDLWRLLVSINGAIVVKPVAGDRGENVRVFETVDVPCGTLIGANGGATTLADFYKILVAQQEPWLIQQKVEQHRTLATLHSSSVNTARLITLRTDDGDITILGAALRIGVGAAEADNTSTGGIATNIDLDTGVCGAATSRSSIRTIVRHPDTGAQIEGLSLPHWSNVKETTIRAHKFLPFARSLGWDVAFGVKGPVILEVNGSWYHNRLQMGGQSLWETELGKTEVARLIRRG